MKKTIIIAALLLVSSAFAATAQTASSGAKSKPSPEEMTEKMASIMAEKLLLSDETSAKFIPLYKEFNLAFFEVNKKYKKDHELKTDKEIDASIRADFSKSQEILDLRKAYYEKFLKVLSPRQIREMYRLEKNAVNKARVHNAKGAMGKDNGSVPKGRSGR